MMLVPTPVVAQSADIVTKVPAAAPTGADMQFNQSLAQLAPQQGASGSSPVSMPAPTPAHEIHRMSNQPSSLGARILENFASMHRAQNPQAAASTDPVVRTAEPGAAETALQGPAAAALRAQGRPVPADNFDAMIETLQHVYGNVIQVSLVSKSVGSFGSSLNKLMSAS